MAAQLNHRRVGRFALVGIANTIIDFGVLNVLVLGLSLPRLAANSLSTTVAMIFSYLMNHHFVFRSTRRKSANHFGQFLIVTGFGLYVIQNGLIYLLTHHFTWPGDAAYSVVKLLAGQRLSHDFVSLNADKLIASIVSLTWNYIVYSRLLFKHQPEPEISEQ